MNQVLLSAGVAAIIIAIAGGGAQAFGVKVPVLDSLFRQGLLGIAGIAFLVLAVEVGGGGGGGGGNNSAGEIKGDLTYLGLERDVKYGVHLAADRLDSNGYTPLQLQRVGNVIEVAASVGGLEENQLPLVWSIYRVARRNKQPFPDPRYLNQPAQPIQLSRGQFVGSLTVWVPIPPQAGTYVAVSRFSTTRRRR
jgi:hypothetical protein